ncbi:hypothetical protein CF319_g7434 [Tilletia indica]|nr:hypothetical protein CF319_g7434 [Tilletia indica]
MNRAFVSAVRIHISLSPATDACDAVNWTDQHHRNNDRSPQASSLKPQRLNRQHEVRRSMRTTTRVSKHRTRAQQTAARKLIRQHTSQLQQEVIRNPHPTQDAPSRG